MDHTLNEPVLGGSAATSDGQFGQALSRLEAVRQIGSESELSTVAGSSSVASSPRSPRQSVTCQFRLDEHLADGRFHPAEHEEALSRVVELIREQQALVKTVKNGNWNELLGWLHGPAFRTPTTLMPSGGKNMRLFREPHCSSCGLVWDINALDMKGAYIWPSGYFAKSEFNLLPDGTLKNGLEQALVTLQQLRRANDRLECIMGDATVKGEVIPFNEVLVNAHGSNGLVGIMVRTTQAHHLLLAMGIRDKIAAMFPELGQLPIVAHDVVLGIRPFSKAAQIKLIRSLVSPQGIVTPPRNAVQSVLPVDTRSISQTEDASGLTGMEQLRFHAKHGIARDALLAVLNAAGTTNGDDHMNVDIARAPSMVMSLELVDVGLRMGDRSTAEVAAFALVGLDLAASEDNAEAAMGIVRAAVPLVFGTDYDASFCSVEDEREMCRLPVCRPTTRKSVTLKNIMSRARSDGVRVAVGACLALESFASGRSRQKISNACKLLKEWLTHSKKLSFRLQSCMDEKRSNEVVSFVSDRIISNRRFFHATLCELYETSDRLSFLRRLHELVQQLLHPCLRLQILQGVLGLDEGFDRDMVLKVVKLTYDLVEAIDYGGIDE